MKALLSANTVIFLDVILFISVGLYMYMSPSPNPNSDAAGNGMAKGFALILGFLSMLVFAVALTIANYFSLKNTTISWLNYLAYLPIALIFISVIVFFYQESNWGRSPKRKNYLVMCEFRHQEKLNNVTSSFRDGSGSSHSSHADTEYINGYYSYVVSTGVEEGDPCQFEITANGLATTPIILNVNSHDTVAGFTDWQSLTLTESSRLTHVVIKYRYSLEAKP